MDRKHATKSGLIWGWINSLIITVCPFLIRTIIIYSLGVEYVGLGGLFASLINILNLSELGFGAALSYLLYRPVAENDIEKVCAILEFSKKTFRIIGLIVLMIGILFIPFLDEIISSDRPENLNIVLLYLIYLANTTLSYFLFAYKRILFAAVQRYDLETKISSIAVCFQYIIQVIVLMFTRNYYFYVAIIPIATCLNNILCGLTTKNNYPRYIAKGTISKNEKDVLIHKVAGAFSSKVGSVVFLSADNIVISAFFGLKILGMYTNYYMMITMLLTVFAVVHNTLRPIVGNSIVTESVFYNFQLLKKVQFFYFWIAAFCSCELLCLLQDFIYVWAGKNNLLPIYISVLISVYWYVARINSIPEVFVSAAGLWWEVRFVSLIETIVNLVLNIILSKTIGLAGIPLSTIASILCVGCFGYNKVLFDKLFGFSHLKEYLSYMLGLVLKSLFVIGVVFCMCLINSKESVVTYLEIVIKGLIVGIVFFVMFLLCNLKNEFLNDSIYKLKAKLKLKRKIK